MSRSIFIHSNKILCIKSRVHDEDTIKNRIWHATEKKDDTYKRELQGEDVKKYFIEWNGKTWISYGEWLAAPRESKFFTYPRLLIREIVNGRILCGYTEEEFYNTPSIINIISKTDKRVLKYLLTLINSKLFKWYHINTSPKAKKGLFPKILVNDVRNLPIAKATPAQQENLAKKADEMIELNKQLHGKTADNVNYIRSKFNIEKLSQKLEKYYLLGGNEFLTELQKAKIKLDMKHEQELLKWFEETKSDLLILVREIETLDHTIDTEVYTLYNLTDNEIKIIEEG